MTEINSTLVGQQQLARIVLAMITMRANTPDGEHISDQFGDTFGDLVADAAAIAGDDVEEYLFLDMMDLAGHFLQELVDVTGRPAAEWLNNRATLIESWESDEEFEELA